MQTRNSVVATHVQQLQQLVRMLLHFLRKESPVMHVYAMPCMVAVTKCPP